MQETHINGETEIILGTFELHCYKQGVLRNNKANKKKPSKFYFGRLTEKDIDEKRKDR